MYVIFLFLVSVQDIITVTSTSTANSINFTFNTTIDGTTPVAVTLSPNVMGEGNIGGGVVISGLMPDTLYTYTVSFVYNNISYSIQSSVTTLTAPTTAASTAPTTATLISGILQGLHTLQTFRNLFLKNQMCSGNKHQRKSLELACSVWRSLQSPHLLQHL